MKDIYVYDNSNVLKNKLGIQDESLFKDAEADYVSFRLKTVAKSPLAGNYDFAHLLKMHYYIFQDLFEWAGQPRVLNIYKEEPVLGRLLAGVRFVSFKTVDILNVKSNFDESVILAMKTGYNNILQSVESDKEVLDNEWKDINWNSIKYGIFKIQKRIFEAEKEGNYRK